MMPLRTVRKLVVVLVGGLMAACSAYAPVPSPLAPTPQAPELCQSVNASDPLVGNWLSKRKEKGVVGELRTLFTLKADGSMLYTEQLKRPRQPSQGLSESGCWWRDGNQLVLKTLESHGLKVDNDDPIYTNHYSISHSSADKLRLRSRDGVTHSTERTSPGYRLPF